MHIYFILIGLSFFNLSSEENVDNNIDDELELLVVDQSLEKIEEIEIIMGNVTIFSFVCVLISTIVMSIVIFNNINFDFIFLFKKLYKKTEREEDDDLNPIDF
ncbi:Hypothetical protein SRAE_2000088500 [Strongyloides ratti]|uniref:Uncharacterized protein n=1 Tax=Strongyloides ratti TaxID=34506 RepID=A0A090LFH5_STRRB|nr:Hypothetical protein SRAE_2000088500 [Strongyloides ratti]CEF66215.1 Hypothetical protein SRAE_2000088500 [Strongyloides ratti]